MGRARHGRQKSAKLQPAVDPHARVVPVAKPSDPMAWKRDTKTKTPTGTGAGTGDSPAGAADASKVPASRADAPTPVEASKSDADVAGFVQKMRAMAPPTAAGRGRLVFAMDATMSRQPTWDMALALQSEMFHAVKSVGGLDVQLVYFRGSGECRASKWVSDPDALARLMTTVTCAGGFTQIRKVLSHARTQAQTRRVHALVHVGDCMEEDIDELCGRAGELALLGVPVFMFQEGRDGEAERAYKEIARLTRGAWCRFDTGSAAQLKALLAAVAVYAAGGRKALEALSLEHRGSGARALLAQIK